MKKPKPILFTDRLDKLPCQPFSSTAIKRLLANFASHQIKILALGCLLFVFSMAAKCQTDTSQDPITNYYKLAIDYKNGSNGKKQDFVKAIECFEQAAHLGDAQSIYSLAYMKYKGFGCTQDYVEAAKLFAKGAKMGRDNSLYFYGLCWRNGYGVARNEDSAKYYLQKAADLGYSQANLELQMPAPEIYHDSAAQVLVTQIHNSAIPADTGAINQYHKIQPHLPSSKIIAGNYKGYLIQYDWSGKHIIYTKQLQLNIEDKGGKLEGTWIEQNTDSTNKTSIQPDTAKIEARIEADSLLFKSSKYSHTDHYSPTAPMQYQFKNAKLNLVEAGDSIFLAGNVEQYSSQRGEPIKPIMIAVSRPGLHELTDNTALTAYPIPFKTTLSVHFNLTKAESVDIQLYTIGGTKVYDNPAGVLEKGYYDLTLQTTQIAGGTYLLRFTHGNNFKTIKVMKE